MARAPTRQPNIGPALPQATLGIPIALCVRTVVFLVDDHSPSDLLVAEFGNRSYEPQAASEQR